MNEASSTAPSGAPTASTSSDRAGADADAADALLAGPAASAWAIRAWCELLERDPLEALADARFLLEAMRARVARL